MCNFALPGDTWFFKRGPEYLVVLVGCHRDEGGLMEDVGAVRRVLGAKGVVFVCLDNVQPGLVLVH